MIIKFFIHLAILMFILAILSIEVTDRMFVVVAIVSVLLAFKDVETR